MVWPTPLDFSPMRSTTLLWRLAPRSSCVDGISTGRQGNKHPRRQRAHGVSAAPARLVKKFQRLKTLKYNHNLPRSLPRSNADQPASSLTDIAAATSHSESYVRTRAQLAFLAPEIQKEILEGRQPPDLTLERIVRKPIPLEWDAQVKLYGFDAGSGHP
ncbi:MAG: hypothetical protein JXR14_00880 [Paracoccaceae bacterium]